MELNAEDWLFSALWTYLLVGEGVGEVQGLLAVGAWGSGGRRGSVVSSGSRSGSSPGSSSGQSRGCSRNGRGMGSSSSKPSSPVLATINRAQGPNSSILLLHGGLDREALWAVCLIPLIKTSNARFIWPHRLAEWCT